MAFEKKWTDEQNAKLLELHGRIPNEEIAKQFNTTASNISKRVSYLRKKKQKSKNKPKKAPKVKKENSQIEVSTAPEHREADEFVNDYKPEPAPTKEENTENLLENELPPTEEVSIPNKEIKLRYTGLSDTITKLINARFKANDLAPLSQEEHELFSNAVNDVLELRMEFIMQYGDIINLGIASFTILTPRILDFLDRKKQKKQDPPKQEPTKVQEMPTISNDERDKQRAMQEYNKILKTQ